MSPRKKVIAHTPTRWNSKYYMLQRLLELKKAINITLIDYKNKNLQLR